MAAYTYTVTADGVYVTTRLAGSAAEAIRAVRRTHNLAGHVAVAATRTK